MNFGKLLAAGRSIMNSRAGVAYRENKHVYLPKFEPAKTGSAKPVASSGGTAAAAPNAPVKLSVAVPSAAKSPASKSGGWSARLNPLARLRGESASAGFGRAVQTELSLETVKVVQNDLRDAEVEVVPLKSRPAREAGEGELDSSWSEVGTGFLAAKAV